MSIRGIANGQPPAFCVSNSFFGILPPRPLWSHQHLYSTGPTTSSVSGLCPHLPPHPAVLRCHDHPPAHIPTHTGLGDVNPLPSLHLFPKSRRRLEKNITACCLAWSAISPGCLEFLLQFPREDTLSLPKVTTAHLPSPQSSRPPSSRLMCFLFLTSLRNRKKTSSACHYQAHPCSRVRTICSAFCPGQQPARPHCILSPLI